MKKITFILCAILAFSFSLKAQQYVSTQPTHRNVILEEFTGRNCGYCTDGHRIANEIMAEFPDRFWAINVHTGGYAPTSYPNMNTTDGATIASGFSISGYPTGNVNRSSAACQDRGQWRSLAVQQMGQDAECNVAGLVVVNPASRLATITVEVYYTGNSTYDENYLTVAMLQDSILGSQADYGNYNPGQWVGNQYVHMHIFRDVVNSTSAWGEAISPTTQGTLITRTYTYEIPETIGSPNGVEVDLNNILFLAWITERYQGTPTRPVLTACKLNMVQGSDEPIAPFLREVSQEASTTCSHTKYLTANVLNGGTDDLTSMKLEVEVEGQTTSLEWTGVLKQFESTNIDFSAEIPFGTHTVTVNIIEANGQPFQGSKSTSVNCMEWQDVEIEGEEETFKLELMQDKFGNQITWEATASDGTVLASGGPYAMLMGSTGTQLHIENFTVPANECVKFTIYDNVGNGICCEYGEGYYKLFDSNNNLIIDGDGAFGSEAVHLLSIKGEGAEVNVGETEVELMGETGANFTSSLDYAGYPDEVGFEYRKVTSSTVNTVIGFINEFKNIFATANDLEPNSIYVVKAYAVVNGQTYYGAEATFNSYDGLEENESSFNVYPNPANNIIYVSGANVKSIILYNSIGQVVFNENCKDNLQIDVNQLPEGVYFIVIENANGFSATRKISVIH